MAYEFNKQDAKFLLEKINDGQRILLAVDRVGLPTIHDIRNAVHCGFGLFRAETPQYKVYFDAGGAMSRCPNGFGYTILRVDRGTFPYDFDAARAALNGIIENDTTIA